MLKNEIYTLARLHNRKGDLSKQWYVSYYFQNPKTGKKQEFKETEGINKPKTVKERTQVAHDLITIVNKRLKAGYNPFQESAVKQMKPLSPQFGL